MASRVLIFFMLIFLVSSAGAADFELVFLREGYAGKDSVQVIIFNNLTLVNDVGVRDIKLYGEERIPLSLNLYKINEGYFLFFNLPDLKNGSYSLVVEDLSFVEDNVLRKESFRKNFSVESFNYSLSVYPMFVDLSLEYWERPKLTFRLRNNFNELNVSVVGNEFIKPRVSEIKMEKDEEYNLIVDIDQDAIEGFDVKGDLIIDYGFVYKIPIYVHKRLRGMLIENRSVVKEEVVVIKEGLRFVEDVDMVNRTINKSISLEGALRFKNFANVTLHGLRFNLTGGLDEIIRIEYGDVDYIDGGEQRYVVLFVNENKNLSKDYNGELVIMTKEGVSAEFPIYIFYEEHKEKKIEEEPIINYTKTIQEEEEESNLALYIVIIVFIGLLIVVASYFYRKSKHEKKRFEELFR